MKYYYLMFANAPRVDYRRLYLTTEGNVLRGLKREVAYSAASAVASSSCSACWRYHRSA